MKILHCVHLYAPAIGGIENHTQSLAKELVASGAKVEVYATQLPRAPKDEVAGGIKISRFPSINVPPFSSVRLSFSMFFAMLKSDADIFHSHGYGSLMPFFTALAALIKHKPFVFTLHGYPRLQGLGGMFQLFYKLFIASFYLRIAKKVIVVSKISVKEMEKEAGVKKVVYIPNGVDTGQFSCEGKESADTITYMGRLDRDKGIDVLLRAFANVRQKFRPVKLAIIGKDEGIRKDLESVVAAFNLKGIASFKEVPYDEINNEYCNSLAIVLPSKYEGFPLVWLEAVASSRPMFSSRVGDYENFFSFAYGSNAELFLFSGEKELYEKLSYFLSNREKFAVIVENARKKIAVEFSWKHVAGETMKLYLSL